MSEVANQEDVLKYQLVGLIPHLRRFARSLTRDPDKADDLVQEACERVLKRRKRVETPRKLQNLLFRIIYNRWIDTLRRRKTRSTNLIILSERNSLNPSDPHGGNQLDAVLDLEDALAKLDDQHRAAIMLIGVEGYSYAEAANVLAVPAGTVASRVARARAKLGKLLFSPKRDPLGLKKSGKENESGI